MKGSIIDILFAIPTLLIIALVILVFSMSSGYMTDAFNNVTGISNETKAKITQPATAFFDTFNYGFLAILITLFVIISSLAYYSNMHPMYFPISVFVMFIAVWFSMVTANGYWEVCNASTEFTTLCNHFWVVTYCMKNLPFIVAVFCFFLAFVTYRGKGLGSQTQQGGL